ncbi:MAG: regulatory protein RecX [Bryobacterales bacterium]|nr:regulatory protein RecX [Bryobacterales bacterium]
MRVKRLDAEALYQYAVKALAARSHAAGELRQKLAARAEKPGDADAVIVRLKEYGYLDDKRFAESYAAARLESQGLGKARVVRDLRRRRVAPAVAERAAGKVYRDTSEEQLIEEFLRRKYRNHAPGDFLREPKNLAAAYRRLLYAGFSSGAAIAVLKRFAADPGLLDHFEPPAEEPEND